MDRIGGYAPWRDIMLRKSLALLIALALCCACVCPALAEDVVSPDVDIQAAPAEWSGAEGLFIEDETPGEVGEIAISAPGDGEETAAPEAVEMPAAGAEETEEPALSAAPEATEEPVLAESPEPTATPVPEATGLTLSASKLTIGLKEKCMPLTVTLKPRKATGDVTWRSANAKIVSINKKTGEMTGKAKGTTTVYARVNGVEAACAVTVRTAPKKVTLSQTKGTMSVGQKHALKATLPSGTGSTLTWTSGKRTVAKVSAKGVITALKPGTATITVKTFNGYKAVCKITVLPEPDQVTLPEKLSLVEGESRPLEVAALSADGKQTVADYTYAIEDDAGCIAIDEKTGTVTGVRPGTAHIRVTAHNGVNSHLKKKKRVETVCAVNVEIGPERIELSQNSATIGVKQSLALAPQIFGSDGEWMEGAKFAVSTSNAKVASVSSKGVVKGLKKGSATITVTAVNGVTAVCRVSVKAAPSKVTLSPAKPTIGVGQTLNLKTTFTKNTMASCVYASSDAKVAAVSGDGKVTGLKPGTATIKVRTHNNKTDKITVTVGKGPQFMALNGEYELVYDALTSGYTAVYNVALDPGETFRIEYENEYQTYGVITGYQSLNERVATVSDSGRVTAVAGGTALIEVTSSSGAKAYLQVKVSGDAPAGIAFASGAVSLRAGRGVAAPALSGENVSAGEMASAKLTSSDKGVFTVKWSDAEDAWMLTGVKPGVATLTAVVRDMKAVAEVTVEQAREPQGIAFGYELIYMNVGERFAPEIIDDQGDAVSGAQLFSSDTGVVNASEDGALTAVGEGNAVITATSGDMSATMKVKVLTAKTTVTLSQERLDLGVGQRGVLKATVNGDGAAAGIGFASSDKAVATVSRTGRVIARGVGSAVITATISGGASASCMVNVLPAPTHLSLEPASVSKRLDRKGAQLKWEFGAPDELGTVTFASADPEIAEVDEKGYVSFKAVGQTTVTATTNNGLSVTVEVKVLPEIPEDTGEVNYRLFAAYSYADSSAPGYLPFPRNNGNSVVRVFGKSDIGNEGYSTKVIGNPTKTQLLSGISGFFSGSADGDVSIVYLCSHGHMDSDYTGYRMSLPGYSSDPASNTAVTSGNANYFITARELFSCISRIRGRVVLILDSCYSGAFLQDMSGQLAGQNGRIAVLTAASNTRATYYNVKDTGRAVDFFTFFLLQGLGYNEREGWWNDNAKGSQGSYPGYLAADAAGDGDGSVTLGEFYRFAENCIEANMPNYMKQSWYWGDWKRVQVPRYYPGALDDLVIYRPSK